MNNHQTYLKAPIKYFSNAMLLCLFCSNIACYSNPFFDQLCSPTFGIDMSLSGVCADEEDNALQLLALLFTGNSTPFITPTCATQCNWSHQAYLKAFDSSTNDNFGNSVAVSGDTLVVGAYRDTLSLSRAGTVHVFVRSGSSWSHQARLSAAIPHANDYFGKSVAISGDTIVVGAVGEDSGGSNSGAVYVFVRSGSSWSQQAFVKAPNSGLDDNFGESLAIFEDTIVVGASREGSNATTITNGSTVGADPGSSINSGAAYVFVRSGSSWSHQAYLKAPNSGASDTFGESVTIFEDTIVVGASREDSNATTITNGSTIGADPGTSSDSGAAYVFVRSGSSWSHQAYLKASGGSDLDNLGISVTISGDTIVVGAVGEDSGGASSGAVYVFVRSGSLWSQQAYFKAPNNGASDRFGERVAISGDIIVVGALYEDSNATTITNGSTIGADPGTSSDSGAAYVFARLGSSWSHQAYLKAPNNSGGDRFGNSVSVSGETIVVGAFYEDSSDMTITNGNTVGADPGASSNSGAAYVFYGGL